MNQEPKSGRRKAGGIGHTSMFLLHRTGLAVGKTLCPIQYLTQGTDRTVLVLVIYLEDSKPSTLICQPASLLLILSVEDAHPQTLFDSQEEQASRPASQPVQCHLRLGKRSSTGTTFLVSQTSHATK